MNTPIEQQDFPFLAETPCLNFSHPTIQAYINDFHSLPSKQEQAIAIYLKVRDGFLYDPYHLDLRPQSLVASEIITKNRAWCVEKAIVCCAALRGLNIPARLGFGIVKNHIGVEKLNAYLKREEIVFHGFVEVKLNNRWTKCTPAFDRRICRLNKVEPLSWDGTTDSLLHAYRGEDLYMEYLHFYGIFQDVPIQLMQDEMRNYYPHLFSNPIDTSDFSFRF